MWNAPVRGTKVKVEGMSHEAVVHDYGMLFYGNDGKAVSTKISPQFLYLSFWNSGTFSFSFPVGKALKMVTFSSVKLSIFVLSNDIKR